jgi:hypothetical protein
LSESSASASKAAIGFLTNKLIQYFSFVENKNGKLSNKSLQSKSAWFF